MAIEFRDEDMRRAWEQAGREDLTAAAQDPERVATTRRRLIEWVAARTADDG